MSDNPIRCFAIMIIDFREFMEKPVDKIYFEIQNMSLDMLRSLIHYITHTETTPNHFLVANIILDHYGEDDAIRHDFILFANTVHMMLFLISRGFFITLYQIIDKLRKVQQHEMTTTWCFLQEQKRSCYSLEEIPQELKDILPLPVPSFDDKVKENRILGILMSDLSQENILSELLKQFPRGSVDNYGFTLLHIIIYYGTVELVDLYLTRFSLTQDELNAQTHVGKTPLMIAVSRGNNDIVRRILKK